MVVKSVVVLTKSSWKKLVTSAFATILQETTDTAYSVVSNRSLVAFEFSVQSLDGQLCNKTPKVARKSPGLT